MNTALLMSLYPVLGELPAAARDEVLATQAQLAGSTPVWSFEIHLRMDAATAAAKP